MSKLTEKQKRFADLYVELGVGADAYIQAGYKVKSNAAARVNASRLLTKANVKSYIDRLIAEKDEKRIAKQDEILEFLTKVLRGEETEQFPIGLGMGEQRLTEKELDGKDRIKAAELLGKRYAMWTDKHQVDGAVGVQIIDDIGDDTS